MKKLILSSVLIAFTSSILYHRFKVMPTLQSIRLSNASFWKSNTSLPVAIFIGGTSGIGQGTAEAFAHHTAGNAHIIIVGRNKLAAEETIKRFPKPTNPDAKYEFVNCDVTLMRNVRAASQEISKRVQKVNYLVMTTGYFAMSGRDESEEGIDKKLAVHYYSRWLFTHELMPLLLKAKEEGEDARVFSVLAAGHGGKLDPEDLGLKKTFSVARAASQAPTYNDLMVMELANRYPSLTFTHAYPGAVRTNLFSSARTAWLRWMGPVVVGLTYPFLTTPRDCGDYMLHGMTSYGPGAFRTGSKGEDLGMPAYSEQERRALWEHTMKEVGVELKE